jgi:hypothetical protein
VPGIVEGDAGYDGSGGEARKFGADLIETGGT